MTLLVAVLAIFWAGAYAIAGWFGVAVMAVLGALGELVLLISDEQTRIEARETAERRWLEWERRRRG